MVVSAALNFAKKNPKERADSLRATARHISTMALRRLVGACGFDLRRQFRPVPGVPDGELYRPHFSPWLGHDFARYYALAAPRTLVSIDRCYMLYTLLSQALHIPGGIIECGVYRGGTAAMMAQIVKESGAAKKLYLFDTFSGMPETDAARDTYHREGDFSDTSLDAVRSFVGLPDITVFRPGFVPETFGGMEAVTVAFAHLDLDIYRSIQDSLEFIWPRLSRGGFIVFDDYGFATCPGAREAVDEFFAHLPIRPLCLPTGQAVVFKS